MIKLTKEQIFLLHREVTLKVAASEASFEELLNWVLDHEVTVQ